MSGAHDPSAEYAEVKSFPVAGADCSLTPWPVIHRALISSLPPRTRMHVFDQQHDTGEWDIDALLQRFGRDEPDGLNHLPAAPLIDLAAERRRRR